VADVISSCGAEGERIAARECGDGMIAVGGLWRPGILWDVDFG